MNPFLKREYEKQLDRSAEYDLIIKKMNPMFKQIVAATKIVRKFIIDRKLIVYGGTAIDCLMRLKGSKLYPDELLEIADLDFISADSVKDAYDLCDILYEAGYKNVRCLQGRHIQTMRVDLEDANYIADIAYCPKTIFDKIKYETFEGMRIVTADMQKIDMHSSFMLCYGNPGAEVIFQRWAKDLKRLNQLESLYPTVLPVATAKPTLRKISIPVNILTTSIAYGYFAYACLYKIFNSMYPDVKDMQVIEVDLNLVKSSIEYESPLFKAEVISTNIEDIEIFEKDHSERAKKFRAFREYLPERYEFKTFTVYLLQMLISYNSFDIGKLSGGGKRFIRHINIQGLLKYLMSQHFIDTKNSETHLRFYVSVRRMIEIFEQKCTSLFKSSHVSSDLTLEEHIRNSWKNYLADDTEKPFLLSIKTYGSINSSDFIEKVLNDLDSSIYGSAKFDMPFAYSPETFKAKNIIRPIFDYNVPFFNFDGEEDDRASEEPKAGSSQTYSIL